jgi:hypothetical protein
MLRLGADAGPTAVERRDVHLDTEVGVRSGEGFDDDRAPADGVRGEIRDDEQEAAGRSRRRRGGRDLTSDRDRPRRN